MIATTIIGAGNMGGALYGGLVAAGKAEHVWLCDESNEKLMQAPENRRLTDPAAAATDCIVLVVKPQSFPALMNMVGKRWSNRFVISVMAGVNMKTLSEATGSDAVIRSMPNLGARVQRAITGWCPSASVTRDQLTHFEGVFSSIGMTVRLPDEATIDGFTAVAGSGPAYVFHLAEMIQNEAEKLGLEESTSARIANELITSAGLLLQQGEKSAAAWREAVTSKGGTTEAALSVLKKRGYETIFSEAIAAAEERSRFLSKS